MKTAHSGNPISIIAISQFLEENANGHFYQLHKTYLTEFERFSKIEYIGKVSNLKWERFFYHPALPGHIARPMPFAKINLIEQIFDFCDLSREDRQIFIYDGNFFWVIRTSFFLHRNKKNQAIINLFNSKQTIDRFCSRSTGWMWRTSYKWLQAITNERLLFTVDNPKYHKELKEKVPRLSVELLPLPIPRYEVKASVRNGNDRFLVIMRGKESALRLSELCRHLPQDIEFDVHGLSKKYVCGLGLPNVKLAKSQIPEEDYPGHIASFSKVIFMYDEKDFEFQSSGRLLDCMALSIPVYIPAHTALPSQILPGKQAFLYSPENTTELYSAFTHGQNLLHCEAQLELAFDEAYLCLNQVQIEASERISRNTDQATWPYLIFGIIYVVELAAALVTLEGRLNKSAIMDKIRHFLREPMDL